MPRWSTAVSYTHLDVYKRQVQGVLHEQALPAGPVESRDFEVGVNEHVARSLGLILDASALRLDLRRLERLP